MHQLCDSTAIPLTFMLRHKYLVTHSGNSLIVSTDMKKTNTSSPNALIGDLVKLDHCRFPLKACGNDDLKINGTTVIWQIK